MTTVPEAPASGRLPVLHSVREGFAFVARDWRAILPLALVGAVLLSPLQVWQQASILSQNPGGVILSSLLAAVVNVPFIAAYFRRAASEPSAPLSLRLGVEEVRLAGATVALLFLYLMIVIASAIVIRMALVALLSRSGIDLNALENTAPSLAADQISKALGAEGGLVFLVLVLAALTLIAWMSARLSLSYPASTLEGRVMIFSTWGWTKGQALRIMLTLLLMLGGAFLLMWVSSQPIGLLIQMVFGKDALTTPGSSANWLFAFVSALLAGVFYVPAYAATLAYLYRGLRPATEKPLST